MNYKLTKVNFVNKSQTPIHLNFTPKDFCCVGEDLYVVYDRGIAKISEGLVELDWCSNLFYSERTDLTQFGSISYCWQNNSMYIVNRSGSQVNKISFDLMEFESLISRQNCEELTKKYLNCEESDTYVASNGKKVVWSVKNCHRCFTLSGSCGVPYIGCGKSGFSVSSLKNTRICHPTGIAIMEDTVCFADSGNRLLRGVNGDSTFNIINDCEGLKNIFYDNKKLFFLSGKTVHMLSSEGDKTHLFEVYKVEHDIQSFCPTGKDCVYILEKNYASPS